MTDTRRDATGTLGGLAVQKTHCDGPLLLDGGPCLCDEQRVCWLVVLPCNCDCPGSVRVVRLDAATDAVWPFESRVAGSAIETADGCFVLMGTTTQRPPGAGEILASAVIAVHPSCDAAPCTDPPCPDQGGFAFTLGSCVGQRRISCLARVRVGYSVRGFFTNSEQGTLRKSIIADGFYELEADGGGSRLAAWAFQSRFRGRDEQGSTREWDYSQSVDQDTPGPAASGFAPWMAGHAVADAPAQPQAGALASDWTIDLLDDLTGLDGCNTRLELEGDTGLGWTGTFENRSHTTAAEAFSASSAIIDYPGENRVRAAFSTVVRVQRVELVDGTVIEFEDCDEPMPSVAMACDADAEPQAITYDAQLLTGLGRTIIDIETDELYIPTTLPSDGEAIAFVENPDGCPDPEPTGEIFRINRCNSAIQATGGEVVGDTVQPRTIGYRVGEGMNPGEGFVYYPGVAENACLFRIPGQPTTEVLEEEPDIVLTSQPGVCSSQPVARIDPRPQCQQQDGGGGVGPSDSQALIDPSTARAFAGQMKNYNCDSCG